MTLKITSYTKTCTFTSLPINSFCPAIQRNSNHNEEHYPNTFKNPGKNRTRLKIQSKGKNIHYFHLKRLKRRM